MITCMINAKNQKLLHVLLSLLSTSLLKYYVKFQIRTCYYSKKLRHNTKDKWKFASTIKDQWRVHLLKKYAPRVIFWTSILEGHGHNFCKILFFVLNGYNASVKHI